MSVCVMTRTIPLASNALKHVPTDNADRKKKVYGKYWRTLVHFVWPLIPLFWTCGDVSSGIQSQSGQPYSLLAKAYVIYLP